MWKFYFDESAFEREHRLGRSSISSQGAGLRRVDGQRKSCLRGRRYQRIDAAPCFTVLPVRLGRTAVLSHLHPELANAPYIVFVDSTRRYVDCSDNVCQLLGYSRAELLTKRIEDISYDLNSVPRLFAEFIESGMQTGDFVLQGKDGNPIPIKYSSFVFSDGCKAAMWQPIKDWREPYLAALVETNAARLQLKLQSATAAIRRAQSAAETSGPEQRALRDALSVLNTLSNEVK